MSTNDELLPPPREPELFETLIEEACAAIRTAERMTPRMEMPLPGLRPTMVLLIGITDQITGIVRYLRRRAEDSAWLTDDRGHDVTDTLARLASAWEAAVASLTIASGSLRGAEQQAQHLGSWVNLIEHGLEPPIATPTDRPDYAPGAVPLGPFRLEPFDLERLLRQRPDGSHREPLHRDACASAWLVAALDAAGVELSDHDRFIAAVIAGHEPATVQVVAGWIARAWQPTSAGPSTASTEQEPAHDDG